MRAKNAFRFFCFQFASFVMTSRQDEEQIPVMAYQPSLPDGSAKSLIECIALYMHEGCYSTLEEVIHHCSDDIHDNEKMNISADDMKAPIAFLHTLSDNSILTDPKFSNPFSIKVI